MLAGWGIALAVILNDLKHATRGFDPWLWLLQGLGLVIFIAAVPVTLWNARLVWTDGRGWPSRIWSVLVALSCALVLYVAARFGLLAMTVNY